jgi:quinol monooxygenase YgiN
MYEIVATFDVLPESREEFINAALQDGHDSRASEPGTRRFELIRDAGIEDERTTERFFLIEAYDNEAAFTEHENGPHYRTFIDGIAEFAKEDKSRLLRGARLDDRVSVPKGAVDVLRVDEICDDLLRVDKADEFKPDHPEHFIGEVRIKDLTRKAGLAGIEVLAVYFGAGARTKPHVPPDGAAPLLRPRERIRRFSWSTRTDRRGRQRRDCSSLRTPHARRKYTTRVSSSGEAIEQNELAASRPAGLASLNRGRGRGLRVSVTSAEPLGRSSLGPA